MNNMINNFASCRTKALRNIFNSSYFHTDNALKWFQPDGFKTGVKVYNPICKEKVDFIIKNEGVLTWYSCGPTVYDSAHIGHASCYIKFDIIQRILRKWFNINVITAMSVTDIDDKIIKKANETGEDHAIISKHYEIEFFNDLRNLNVIDPVFCLRVTEHIPHILQFIKRIIDKGYAYSTKKGSVYFKVADYMNYGKLVPHVQPDVEQIDDKDEDKLSPHDFALWKGAKPGETYWESPWGKGRPGWHIECSAMASSVFGPNIDVHSGGIDLKFPHHENEEAQSCSHHSCQQWVNYWLHSGHLHFKGDEKMSKSLNNVLSITDLLEKYSADQFRMLCLLSPYRNNMEFSEDAMLKGISMCNKIESFLAKCEAYVKGQYGNDNVVDEPAVLTVLNETRKEIRLCLSDDFNTPKSMSSLNNLVSSINKMLDEQSDGSIRTEEESYIGVGRSPMAIAAVYKFVSQTLSDWGLSSVTSRGDSEIDGPGERNNLLLTSVLDTTVDFRNRIRHTIKNVKSKELKPEKKEIFETCDKFRNDMMSYGIEIQDHGTKSSWSFVNSSSKKSTETSQVKRSKGERK